MLNREMTAAPTPEEPEYRQAVLGSRQIRCECCCLCELGVGTVVPGEGIEGVASNGEFVELHIAAAGISH
jgi:hypothetical protein